MMEKKADVFGFAGVGISAVGMIATIITNNPIPISVGSTIGIGCNLFSRRQLNNTLVESHNAHEQKIDGLMELLESNKTELKDTILDNQTELANKLEEFKLQLQGKQEEHKNDVVKEVDRLELQYKQLSDIVGSLQQVENLSQELRVKPNSAEFFYQRGVSHRKLMNQSGAIEDYTEAIKLDPRLAKAYHQRGIVYLDADNKQKAVDDLRKAALLYFEHGDIESYHQAREMSRNIHELHAEENGVVKEMVVGSQLFE